MASAPPIGGALAAGPAPTATMRLDAAATFRNTLAMLAELVAATLMVLLTVLIHGTGIYGLGRAFQRHYVQHHALHTHPLAPRTLALSLALMVGLFALHGVEIWTYAAFFLAVDALPNLREAVYFSTASYATIGYSDAAIDPAWKLVAAIEGVNGIILLGWSTAFVVHFMTRLARR